MSTTKKDDKKAATKPKAPEAPAPDPVPAGGYWWLPEGGERPQGKSHGGS